MAYLSRKKSPALLFLIVAAAAFTASALYFVLNGVLNADEGFYLLASQLVKQGFRPYRDFGFTQGPLLPYFNVPWLEIFGYDLTGQRLTSLAWVLVTIAIGCWWLIRRGSVTAAALFLLLLTASPNWTAYVVKGKTYSFGALTVLLAVIAWQSGRKPAVRWAMFLICAAVGVGSRFPLAGFFVPAAVCFLAEFPTWRARLVAVGAATACAVIELFVFGHGAWDNFYFWTVQFHRESTFQFSLMQRYGAAFLSAPGVWVLSVPVLWYAIKRASWQLVAVMVALYIGVLANLCTRTTYAEYVFPFIPALALVCAENWQKTIYTRSLFFASVGLALLGGFSRIPDLRKDLLVETAEVVAFVRSVVPPDSVIVASMPEIPVACGARIPLELAMGKFGLTNELDGSVAEARHMVTPASLCALIDSDQTQAVVVSPAYNWSFFWSVPSYRPLSVDAQNQIRRTINLHFEPRYMTEDYVVFVRRRAK